MHAAEAKKFRTSFVEGEVLMSVSRVLVVLSFLLGVPAFAQFEVAPDHFDAVGQKSTAQQVKAHTKIKAVQTAVVAQKGQQELPAATGGQQVSSSQAVNAGSRKVSGKTSVASRRKPALKTRTVSVLQPIRRSD